MRRQDRVHPDQALRKSLFLDRIIRFDNDQAAISTGHQVLRGEYANFRSD
ncbi:hypothetical protein [Ktedonobacter robiniae]|uniref:Uncharacterized protein n=1 Tax=Ktedonobacter robiniae TaxID=2778365 RepID=A0ABQ3UTV2_9CHLR|nr:hypothetical protein [Ktedonobacter robiniae]GHO56124.1 hypothetical protein KSB_45990 [Ktedonobacter robiniae]